MENNETVTRFEADVRADLFGYLVAEGAVDSHHPECPDVEAKWAEIARAYLPDGAREFQQYPVVSLGWMMFIGMAMAYYWDTDWEAHAAATDNYQQMRDLRGFDNMDEAILNDVLGYPADEAERLSDLVSRCAQRVYSLLGRSHVEPGTDTALGCFIAALHQLYLAGMSAELKALGYKMSPLGSGD